MASRFKNESVAGTNGAATRAWRSVSRPSGMQQRRDTVVVEQPCGLTSPTCEHRLAAAIEGKGLGNRRQLKT